jgi:hypothetical protein
VSGCTWKVTLFALSLLAGNAIAAPAARSADKYERKVPYTGPKLASPTVMCKARRLATAGFWHNLSDATVHEGARIEQESKPTYWRISIIGQSGTARVIRFNANLEALEDPVIFTAEPTPGGGLLLVGKNREPGTSPETISIDPLTRHLSTHRSTPMSCITERTSGMGACAAYE